MEYRKFRGHFRIGGLFTGAARRSWANPAWWSPGPGSLELLEPRSRSAWLLEGIYGKYVVQIGAQVGPFPIFNVAVAKGKDGAAVMPAGRLFV